MPVANSWIRRSAIYWVLVGFLCITFLTGGSARSDAVSLILLRPLAVIACAIALWRMPRAVVYRYRMLLGFAAATVFLVALHLIPLPPAVWTALPGRSLVAEMDRLTGIGEIWRPISLTPNHSWNALFALIVPIAALLLAIRLDEKDRAALVPALIVITLISVLFGALQAVGPSNGPLYLYRITNFGSPVGLFANRNHFAVFTACVFPMLAFWASQARNEEAGRVRVFAAAIVALLVIPVIVLAGSRAGLGACVLGLGFAVFVYRRPIAARAARSWRFNLITLGAFTAMAIALAFLFLSRSPLIDQIVQNKAAEDRRLPGWEVVTDLIWQYWPAGSGIGSFVEVYKVAEPDALLQPSYFNHAHNDLLELLLTGGLPALLLAIAALVVAVPRILRLWRQPSEQPIELGRLATLMLLILLLASIADYPLRVPSLACFAVILLVWIEGGAMKRAPRDD